MVLRKTYLVAAIVALAHLIAVGATAWYESSSDAGQAPMVWVYWAFIDFPVSLLYASLNDSVLIVHGIIGTLWWFVLLVLLSKMLTKLLPKSKE